MPKRKGDDAIFQIDYIVDKRVSGTGKVEYKIRWEGYTEKDDTWEPSDNIYNKDLITDFELERKGGAVAVRTTSEPAKSSEAKVQKKEKPGAATTTTPGPPKAPPISTTKDVRSDLKTSTGLPAPSPVPASLATGPLTAAGSRSPTANGVATPAAPPAQTPPASTTAAAEAATAGSPAGPSTGDGGGGLSRAEARAEAYSRATERFFERAKQLKPEDIPETAKEIAGATMREGELTFLIKWNGDRPAELVPAKIANIRYPQQVIQYYEKRLCWHAHDQPMNEHVAPTTNGNK